MAELAKKLPTVVAIVALAFVGDAALARGLDGVIIAAVVTAIAGLGGFYLHSLLPKRGGGP